MRTHIFIISDGLCLRAPRSLIPHSSASRTSFNISGIGRLLAMNSVRFCMYEEIFHLRF